MLSPPSHAIVYTTYQLVRNTKYCKTGLSVVRVDSSKSSRTVLGGMFQTTLPAELGETEGRRSMATLAGSLQEVSSGNYCVNLIFLIGDVTIVKNLVQGIAQIDLFLHC